MKKNEFIEFGKKKDNVYKIIERKYKDDSIKFFVEITNYTNTDWLELLIKNIYEKSFKTYDEALVCVNNLKKDDKKITVAEEKIHTL